MGARKGSSRRAEEGARERGSCPYKGGGFGLANRDADAGGQTKLTTGKRKRAKGRADCGCCGVGSGWKVTADTDRWGWR